MAKSRPKTVDKTVKVEGNGGGPTSKSVRFQVSKAVKDGKATVGTERMSAILNKRVQVYFLVDTMASKSVVTEETLGDLQLEMPVVTQRLKEAVRFQLADNSEVLCSKISISGPSSFARCRYLFCPVLRAIHCSVRPSKMSWG